MGGRGSGGRNVLSDEEKKRRGTYRPSRSQAARAGTLRKRNPTRGFAELERRLPERRERGPQPFGQPSSWKDDDDA